MAFKNYHALSLLPLYLTIACSNVDSMAKKIEVGAQAPLFTAQDTAGEAVDLKDLLQKGPVVLAFFPKAFTPG